MPGLRSDDGNTVPACVTPARLMEFVRKRNGDLDSAFERIADLYKTHGEDLGVRWDYAFFHMLVKTGDLNSAGPKDKARFNFAAIQTADGRRPERFASVETGVLAHLHHIRLYAGDPVDKPAARRTREVRSFILPWAKKQQQPVTFTDLTRQWSPGDEDQPKEIEKVARAFMSTHCPAGDRIAEPKAKRTPPAAADVKTAALKSERGSKSAPPEKMRTDITREASAAAQATSARPPLVGAAPSASEAANCKVWTASFGGERSVLIRVKDGSITHFTALQVNAGREQEETKAYIAAYARGGRTIGEFTDAAQAINKAFELCPKA
jgi:hypothetical protein